MLTTPINYQEIKYRSFWTSEAMALGIGEHGRFCSQNCAAGVFAAAGGAACTTVPTTTIIRRNVDGCMLSTRLYVIGLVD
jgi:hypothetical protein